MERVMRFELTTASLATRGSTTELHPHCKIKNTLKIACFELVPQEGLEPPRLAALVPKTSVSTNSTTEAKLKKPSQQKRYKGYKLELVIRIELTTY
jgi:ribulose 1,5-bisphosphate carboxylase large subunit-like protein